MMPSTIRPFLPLLLLLTACSAPISVSPTSAPTGQPSDASAGQSSDTPPASETSRPTATASITPTPTITPTPEPTVSPDAITLTTAATLEPALILESHYAPVRA